MPLSPIIRGKEKKHPMRMSDAQDLFRNVVKAELDSLLSAGWERADAVKALLGRIVEYSESPGQDEVYSVMEQFRMNKEDATRALIVKQELGRLKRRGLNNLEAIEELTMKMQGMQPMSLSGSPNNLDTCSNRFHNNDSSLSDDGRDEHEEEDEEVPHQSPSSHRVVSIDQVFGACKKANPASTNVIATSRILTPDIITSSTALPHEEADTSFKPEEKSKKTRNATKSKRKHEDNGTKWTRKKVARRLSSITATTDAGLTTSATLSHTQNHDKQRLHHTPFRSKRSFDDHSDSKRDSTTTIISSSSPSIVRSSASKNKIEKHKKRKTGHSVN